MSAGESVSPGTPGANESPNVRDIPFQTIVESIPGVVYWCELAMPWRVYYVSPEIAQLTGYDASTFLSGKRQYGDLILAEDLPVVENGVKEAVETKRAYELDYRIRHADGKIRYVHEKGKALYDEQGLARSLTGVFLDVTEARHTEQRLIESEMQFRSLFENMTEGLAMHELLYDAQGTAINYRLLRANPAYYRHTGLPEGTASGQLATDLYGTSEPPFLDVYTAVALTGVPCSFETDFAPMGRRFSVSVFSLHPGTFATVFEDISPRHRAEEALKFTQFAIDNAGDAAFWITPAGGFVYTNRAASALLGYSAEELRALRVQDLIPDYSDELWTEEWQYLEKLPAAIERAEVRTRDGRLIPVEVQANVLEFSGRRYVCAFARNITEREAAERALHDSTEQYRALFNAVTDAVIVSLMPDDTNPAQILEVNDIACSLLGYSREELLALEDMRQLNAPESGVNMPALYAQLRAGNDVLFEQIRITKEGKRIPVEVHSRTFMYQGHLAVLSASRDISERKRAEDERRRLDEQMREAQKLESLGVLAGGIAHDFNNMLMAIMGNADLALKDISNVSPARPMLEEIERTAHRAAELCRQMLAYSGRGHFVIAKIALSELVREMGYMLQVSIPKKVVLRYNLTDDLPAIEADATQLRQVVMNLILNAAEAIGERSGVVSITTGLMECDRAYLKTSRLGEDLPEGFYVFLEVTDTGCGMDSATIHRIFEPFFTTKFTGRGLGLAAALGIVRGHKGAVRVYSETGKGTSFKVLFPASESEADALPAVPGLVKTWRSDGTILVVDDEETIRALCHRMLERLGFSVVTAADGREALAIFQRNPGLFRCVFLDLTMPHMDGEETFRELRRIAPKVRVVISSGYDEQEVVSRFSGKGLAGFIQKPYRTDTLVEILQAVLGEQSS